MFAQQAEAFSRQHEALYKQFQTPERTMSVCDVCGVFINSTDNDQRRAVRAPTSDSAMVAVVSEGQQPKTDRLAGMLWPLSA